MNAIAKDELDRIFESPISEDRKSGFLQRYLKDRETAGTVEMLFERVHALDQVRERPPREEVAWTGFNVLVFKGPFVDLSNWAPPDTRSFAGAMERRLLEGIEEALRDATLERLGEPVNRDAVAVLRSFETLGGELARRGYAPSVFVLAGPLGTQLAVDLQERVAPAWHEDVKRALRTTFRIMGMHGGIPILDIPESRSPGIYAVDLGRFAHLICYGDEPFFEVKKVTREQAQDLIAKDPARVLLEGGADGDPARQFQLRVWLELYETFRLDVLDEDAADGSPLVGPVLEWEPQR